MRQNNHEFPLRHGLSLALGDNLDAGAGADPRGAGPIIALASAAVLMPPAALTPISGPTTRRINATSSTVAPLGPKPVEVLT